jgi:sec-independent protein translocase protein TatA
VPNLGFSELVIIFLIVVVLFGASRLPQLGRGLGEGISNFRKGLNPDNTKGKDPAVEAPSDERA